MPRSPGKRSPRFQGPFKINSNLFGPFDDFFHSTLFSFGELGNPFLKGGFEMALENLFGFGDGEKGGF